MDSRLAEKLAEPEIWVALAFVMLVAVLVWKKVPSMIAKSLDQRAAKIKDQLDQAKHLKEEAQALLAEYQRKHRDAAKDAEEMMAQARADAENFKNETKKSIATLVERQTRAAEEKIAQAEARAIKEVEATAAEVAVQAARKILAKQMKSRKGTELVDKTIKDLGKHLH